MCGKIVKLGNENHRNYGCRKSDRNPPTIGAPSEWPFLTKILLVGSGDSEIAPPRRKYDTIVNLENWKPGATGRAKIGRKSAHLRRPRGAGVFGQNATRRKWRSGRLASQKYGTVVKLGNANPRNCGVRKSDWGPPNVGDPSEWPFFNSGQNVARRK